LGVHRRVVRQALVDAVPPPRGYVARAKPTLTPVQAFIDRILESDRLAPRKQRHTARRIYDRLCRERPEAPVAASTVTPQRRSHGSSAAASRTIRGWSSSMSIQHGTTSEATRAFDDC
jgi:hypothetical protein